MKKHLLFLLFTVLSVTAYCQRNVYTINDIWYFHKGNISTPVSYPFNDKKWQLVNLPHCWNAADGDKTFDYYRGIGWYSKILSEPIRKGKRYYIHFEGAFQLTDVYVNAKYAGRHIGGYTGFTFDVTDLLSYAKDSINVISAKLDSRFNKDIAPLSGDFTFWGGIYRDVYLVEVDPIHFSMDDYGSNGIFIDTPDVSSENATVQVRSSVRNDAISSKYVKVESIITNAAGEVVSTFNTKTKLLAGKVDNIKSLSSKIHQPHLWTPDNPYLYHVTTRVIDIKNSKILDEVVNPLGFRWFSVDAQNGFMLNGKPIKLIGAARHQDYPGKGSALSNDMNYRDVKLLKEMGANFIRIAHYPQAPSVLDACDKLGVIAWEEIPIVNAITTTSAFYNNCKYNLVEMIHQNYNHPSIFIWSYCNEVMLGGKKENKEYCDTLVQFLKKMESVVRIEDPRRITSIAFHAGDIYDKYGVGNIPMTVGWNRYDGLGTGHFQSFSDFLNDEVKKYPKRSIFISEYGVGSDARIHSLSPQGGDYSIEFQQSFHEYYLPEILKRKFVVGSSLWNLIDFGSALRKESMPHVNNKGILHRDREPKDVYYYYQAMLAKKPVVYIASRDWTLRAGTACDSVNNFAYQKVKIYSNLKQVELFLNHKSLGKQSAVNCNTIYNVPFIDGKNLLEVRAIDTENQYVYDDLTIDFKVNPYNLNAYKKNDLQIAVNAGSNCFYLDNDAKIIYQPDQLYREGNWGYIGKSVNTTITQQEIGATDNGPLYQTGRENMKEYKFDVPDGVYNVDLSFCEPVSPVRKSLYILDSKDVNILANRVFNVFLNEQKVLSDFNIAKNGGALTAVIKTYTLTVKNGKGINIMFEPIIGKPIISGIKIMRMY